MNPKSDATPTWKSILDSETKHEALPLPCAHDALTAKLIERSGFKAFQIGGFATVGTRHGWPDIDLAHFGEESVAARDILAATTLPVLVDCDDGYGDVKNVTHVVRSYVSACAAAIFVEDQQSPKKCGHMNNKKVVPPEVMVQKLKAAVDARDEVTAPEKLFILARTDAIAAEDLDAALKRAEQYLKAKVDGVYFEAVQSEKQLEQIGKAFGSVPLATSILENGGKTPFVGRKELRQMGFTMVLYPTTVLFRAARAIEKALTDMRDGKPLPKNDALDMQTFEEVVGIDYWKRVERRAGAD